MSSFLDWLAGSSQKTAAQDTLAAFQDLLNQAKNIGEPDLGVLVPAAYSSFKSGKAIPQSELTKYEKYFNAAGIKSPGEITSYVTQDLAARPENRGYLPLSEDEEKMAAYYGAPNVFGGKYTGLYGRGLGKIEGRPGYT
jgi:hypothetical protein